MLLNATTFEEQIQNHLTFLYGPDMATTVFEQLQSRLIAFRRCYPELAATVDPTQRLSERDSILITYGDQVQEPGRPTLTSLTEFLETYLKGVVSTVHLLPFYPSSSDDGFAVIDYTAVSPVMGTWTDVVRLGKNFRLMFDVVVNHISAQSQWFQGFLQGNPKYAGYFITEDPATDLSRVTRPRALALLTSVEIFGGRQYVWTTFSPDQIDLNYKNPAVLLDIIDVLLFYIVRCAEFIRLDAIAYLWKEVGTPCIHLPQTHRVVQLFRAILDLVAPQVSLITETNVPHQENISYFGDGRNEAQLVYNFSLAPLILHTFHTGNAEALQVWAAGLEKLPNTATFFNFIASHDGIGVRPAEGILTPAQLQVLVDKTLAHGGQVSYKTNPDGSQSAYELNLTLFDALSDPKRNEPQETKINRFLVSQAIMLALAGLPGIYIHSLVGSSNDDTGYARTGRARSLNRQKWSRLEIEALLANPASRPAQVFGRYVTLLKVRASCRAFHPNGGQRIITTQPALFALWRISPEGCQRVLCVHNISAQPQQFEIGLSKLPVKGEACNLLSGESVVVQDRTLRLTVAPYEVRWLAMSH